MPQANSQPADATPRPREPRQRFLTGRFYLLFREESAARAAARDVGGTGFVVDVCKNSVGWQWSRDEGSLPSRRAAPLYRTPARTRACVWRRVRPFRARLAPLKFRRCAVEKRIGSRRLSQLQPAELCVDIVKLAEATGQLTTMVLSARGQLLPCRHPRGEIVELDASVSVSQAATPGFGQDPNVSGNVGVPALIARRQDLVFSSRSHRRARRRVRVGCSANTRSS